ncbi:MAG TPA: molybdopterin-dependent oxidoreductase [Candidatus Binatia bacterium]|nr:molybdopterin-dependent oxidoreductase [Candidatus Binatia bacterium]
MEHATKRGTGAGVARHDVVRRSCPVCEASCGLVIEVDRAAERVVAIHGDEEDPRSRGYLCPKAFAPAAVHADPDRLRRPIRRDGDRWREIAWDEAFDLVARRLKATRDAHGPHAIATYIGNPTGHNVGAMLWSAMFIQALGSERTFSAATVDQFPKNFSSRVLYGDSWLFPIPDLDRTDYFLCLGANPVVSQGSLMSAPDMKSRLRALRARGAKVVVIDPRRTETAALADEHHFIRPGSDALFLFAIAHVLFAEGLVRPGRLAEFTDGIAEVGGLAREFSPEAVAAATGIAPDVTRRIARELAAAPRAVCYGRQGTCTVEFGTLASWLVDVVNLLTGNLDRAGGFMFPRPATGHIEPSPHDSGPIPYARFRSRVRGFPEFDGQLPVAVMAEEIDSAGDDRMRAMVTLCGNPVLSTPNGDRLGRALATLDFMVSVDIYLNETTRHAHVILPTTTAFEETNFDFLFQTTSIRNMARWSPRVFEPAAGALSHWRVMMEIAARLNDTTVATYEQFLFEGMLSAFVGVPGGRCADVDPAAARAQLARESGPDRLIDLMVRSGPYGDRFDDDAAGLSVAKLRAVPHAVDLGPLEPRLPDVLKTPGRRIPLAHELFVRDVPRLRAKLAQSADARTLLLVGRRQLRNMNSWLHNVDLLARGRERCTLLVHPADAARLGLSDGGRARVRSRVGEVSPEVCVSDEMMPGVVSLPHGFGHTAPGSRLSVASRAQPGVNANQLADELLVDELSGTSVVNGVPVEVLPA